MTISIWAHIIIFLAQGVHLSPLQAVGEVYPGPEVVGVEAGGAVQLLAAVLIGLQAGIRRFPHHAAEGIVVCHLLRGARLVEDHADVAQMIAEVEMVLRRAVGGEGDIALVGEQPALAPVVYHVAAVVDAAQLVLGRKAGLGVRARGAFSVRPGVYRAARCKGSHTRLHAVPHPVPGAVGVPDAPGNRNHNIYDLRGRKIPDDKDIPHGIYIRDGKKIAK